MNNVIQLPIIAGVQISTDDEGRFNLNLLHKASGLGKHKSPNKWLEGKQVNELIKELESQTPNSGSAINVKNGGVSPGTFAHELLAISYAGWISPSFQLQVNQVFLNFRSGSSNNPAKLSRIEILQLAMKAEEENQKLLAQVEVMKPKVEALDRISTSDGSLCITDAAKDLQTRPKDLFAWLNQNKWIYKRAGCSHWVAYQDKIQTGRLEHKVTVVSRSDGSEKTTEQVRITPKGLAYLAKSVDEKKVA